MAWPNVLRLLLTLLILGAIAVGVALYVPPVNGYTNQWLGERAGQRLVNNQQWADAEATLAPLVDEFPHNATIGRLYAESLSHPPKQGKALASPPDNAVATWQRLREQFPKDSDIALGYAKLLAHYPGQRSDAVSIYRGLLAQGSDEPDPALLNSLAHTFLQAAGQETNPNVRHWLMQWAGYYYQASLGKDGAQFKPRFQLGVIHQQLAGQLKGVRPQVQLANAARHYCNAILIRPNHVDARFNMGLALMNAKAVEAGVAQMTTAINLLMADNRVERAQALSQQAQAVKNSLFYISPNERRTPQDLDELLAQCLADPRLAVGATPTE